MKGTKITERIKDMLENDNKSNQKIRKYLWLYWILVNTIGIAISLGSLGNGILEAGSLVGLGIMFIAAGAIVGCVQAMFFQCLASRLKWWILASAVGWAINIIVFFFVLLVLLFDGNLGADCIAGAGGLGALSGVLCGSAQWLVLRGQFEKADLWILMSAAGWGVAIAAMASFVLYDNITHDAIFETMGERNYFVVLVLVPGLLYGIITAKPLITLTSS